jgi:hypothetical protein
LTVEDTAPAGAVLFFRHRRETMTQIKVEQTGQNGQYRFRVTVREDTGQTNHRVTLEEGDYQRLTGGEATPAELVESSFRFLLEREPKESILRSFDLVVINRYFPEYEREMRRRLWST